MFGLLAIINMNAVPVQVNSAVAYKAGKRAFLLQTSDAGARTKTVAVTCAKNCTSEELREFGLEQVDQLPGVQFLENLGLNFQEVVVLQSGDENQTIPKFPDAASSCKLVLTLFSYFNLLKFLATEEWRGVEAAAELHKNNYNNKDLLLEGGVVLRGKGVEGYIYCILEKFNDDVFLVLRASLTDKISLSVKYFSSSCSQWIQEQGCVVFDLETLKQFAKCENTINTAFYEILSIATAVTATPPTPVMPVDLPTQLAPQQTAQESQESQEYLDFPMDLADIESQSLLQLSDSLEAIVSKFKLDDAPETSQQIQTHPPPPPPPALYTLTPLPVQSETPAAAYAAAATVVAEKKKKSSSKNKENYKNLRKLQPRVIVPMLPRQFAAAAAYAAGNASFTATTYNTNTTCLSRANTAAATSLSPTTISIKKLNGGYFFENITNK